MKRVFAALLLCAALAMLALPAAAAGDVSPWAQEAVAFCVTEGLLSGDDLRPQEAATRAELAAMIVRLLEVEPPERTDLSGWSDVNPAAWYAPELSAAVAAGILEGSDGRLRPDEAVTRQEAMIVLARAFGVPDGDAAALDGYADAWQLDEWAVGPAAGLAAEGIVQGGSGRLRPQEPLAREDLAQLLHRLAGTVAEGEADLPERGPAVLRAGELSDRTVDGTLCLTAGETVLDNVEVTGRIVVSGGTLRMTGGSRAAEVVLCGRGAAVEGDGETPVRVVGRGATVSGGGRVTASADVTLRGGLYPAVQADGAAVTVASDARVETAELAGQGSRLTGPGQVDEAVVRTAGCAVETDGTAVVEMRNPGIGQVQMTLETVREATPTQPEAVVTVRFSNVGDAAPTGILSWYGDGQLAGRNLHLRLTEGAQATVTVPADYSGRVSPEMTVLVQFSADGETVQATGTVDRHIEQLKTPVRTLEVEATVRRDTGLYQTLNLSGRIGTVPAGTVAVYINYSGTYSGKIRLPDGTTGWVRWSDLLISGEDYVQYTDYDRITKENFVNSIGYESTSQYLVWISLLTQKVNVFEGSCRNWELVQTFPCTTGKNTTPTIGGVFRYQYRQNYWDFGSYYVNRPMIFNGGHAFHTRTYIKGTSSLLDPTMGSTASQGCVRMLDDDVDWLWDNMPFGTTVVVY